MFANRIDWDLETNALAGLLAHKRRAGERIWDLTESNPTRAGLDYPENEILDALASSATAHYEPSPKGLPAAREAVARYYRSHGARVAPDGIFLTPSTSDAYSYLFKLLCEPGSEILVPQPSYPLFRFLAALDGARSVTYPIRFDGTWHLDVAALETCLCSRARAVVAVHPNNPTGSYVSDDERRRLLGLAAANDLSVIVDEVFLDYPLSRQACNRSFADANEGLVFVLGGLSKLAGLPQMKLAWIAVAGDEEHKFEAKRRLEHITDTYLSVGTPVQSAAPRFLELAPRVSTQIGARTRENLERLKTNLAECPEISLLPPEGGWYATLRLPAVLDSEAWALSLLEEASVYLHPGTFFGFVSGAVVVVSLLPRPGVFREGLGRVLRLVRDRIHSSGG